MGLIVGPIVLFLMVALLAAAALGVRWVFVWAAAVEAEADAEAEQRRPCHGCGYDLRGTLAAGREACPECGERARVWAAGIPER